VAQKLYVGFALYSPPPSWLMNRKNCFRTVISSLAIFWASLISTKSLLAQTSVYWDINGVTAGAGGAAPAGEWNATNQFWNTNADGLSGTIAAWTPGVIAIFSAGADATGAYTVGVTGTHNIRGLTFQEGTVTLQGGTLNLAAASTINVAESLSATLDAMSLTGNFALTKDGKGRLKLTGATTNSFTGNFRLGSGTVELATTGGNALGMGNIHIESTFGASGNVNSVTLQLMAADQISDTAHVTVVSRQYRAALFDLNGFQETVGGLTIVGVTGTNNIGVKTGADGVLTVKGDINLHNDRGGSTGNSVRDVLITGTGSRTSVQADSGILDLGGDIRTITVQSRAATLYGSDDATIETTIRNGGIIKAGGQKLILLGTNIYSSGTTISEGTLQLGVGGTTGSIIGDVVNNAFLEFNRSNAYTFAGEISGTGAVNKLGAGILTLSGTNAYTGLTTVMNGSLELQMLGTAGALTGTNVGTNAVIALGDSTANVGLIYKGAGETTDKVLRLAGTTGNVTLTAAGTGAVVFQNALDVSGEGDKTLILTGTNTDANALMGGISDATGGGVTSLQKTGTGTWVLGGANSYTGTTTVNGGTLRLTGAGTISQSALVIQNGNIDVAGAQNVILNGDPDVQLDTKELISYALMMGGGSAGSEATLTIGNDRTLTLNSHVAYSASGNNLGASINGGTLHLGDGVRVFTIQDSSNGDPDLTISSQITAGADTTLMKAGPGRLALTQGMEVNELLVNMGRLDLGGSVNVVSNSLLLGYSNTASLIYSTPGGQLSVGSGSTDTLDIGVNSGVQGYSYGLPSGIMDLRGSSSFTANVGMVSIGVNPHHATNNPINPPPPGLNGATSTTLAAPSGNLVYLPTNSSIIASTSFVMGDAISASVGALPDTHWVEFGEGESTVRTPSMYIGYRKASATVTIREGGSLHIQGVADNARSDLYIGYNAVNTAIAGVSRMEFINGTLTANLRNLVVGWKSGVSGAAGSSTARLTLGEGDHDVDVSGKITLGYVAGNHATVSSFGDGTLNMAAGNLTVAGNVELAMLVATDAAATNPNFASRGTLNLTGGTFTVNGNVITTADALNRNTATVNLDGGTLDMTEGSIGAANALITFNVHSGGLRGLAEYNGGIPLIKTTEGLLTLGGVNSYTGGTVINGGTLEVLVGSRTGVGNTTVNGAGAVLAGEGTVSANALLTLGNIRPGENGGEARGMLTFANDLTLNAAPGSASTLQLGIKGATGIADLSVYAVSQIPDAYDFTSYNSETPNLGDHDLVRVQGSLTWNEGTQLVVEDEGVSYAYGQVFNLLDWNGLLGGGPSLTSLSSEGGVVNAFLTLPSLSGTGFSWDLSLFSQHGVLVVVPEPGRAVLMLLGLGLVGLRRRR
jgi:fibronectin-binding autotransporter adhesin